MLIGLCGYARTGKDVVGQHLVRSHGFIRYAKGDLIREAALAMDPYVLGADRLSAIVERTGWETAKRISEVRLFLQNLADGVTGVLGRDVWSDRLYDIIDSSGMKDEDIVLTRLSLRSEADRVRERGGFVWRIERPGTGPVNSHPNETALDGYAVDATIVNDGSLADLEQSVMSVLTDCRAKICS